MTGRPTGMTRRSRPSHLSRAGSGRPPRVAWSIDLGGPRIQAATALIRDVTGDGQDDILILGNDTVECRQATGLKVWKLEGYSSPSVVDIRDYAGDGGRGIVLTTTVGGRVETFMIDGRSGRSIRLWKDENNFGGHTRYGKLLVGVAGAQVASTSSGQTPPEPYGGNFRLVSFERGLDRPHFRIRKFLPGDFYSPLMLFDDVDADGAVEMVVISHEALWTFDTTKGEQELTGRYAPMIRTYYASIASVKLSPADRYPALVMINPHLPGLEAVRQDGKSETSRLWKAVVGGKEDQYQAAIRITPGGADVVADLDGDGRPEVLASITNEHGDQLQHLVVFDAGTGRRLAEAGDERSQSRSTTLTATAGPKCCFETPRGCDWLTGRGMSFREIWRGDRVDPLLRPLALRGSP